MGGECKRARFSSSRLSGIALREEFFQEQDALLPGHVSSVLRAALLPADVARAPEWLDAPVARAQQLVFVRVRGVEPQALASEHAAAEDGSAPLPFLSSMAAIKTLLREPRFSCSTTLHDAADLILAPIRSTAPCCNRGAPSRRARPRALAPRLALLPFPATRLTPNPAPPGLPTRRPSLCGCGTVRCAVRSGASSLARCAAAEAIYGAGPPSRECPARRLRARQRPVWDVGAGADAGRRRRRRFIC